MPTTSSQIRVALRASSGAENDPRLRLWHRTLVSELRSRGVRLEVSKSIHRVEGVKGGGDLVPAIVVALGSSSVLVAVVQAVQAFVGRAKGSRVHLEIDGDIVDFAGSDEKVQEIVDVWLERQRRNLSRDEDSL